MIEGIVGALSWIAFESASRAGLFSWVTFELVSKAFAFIATGLCIRAMIRAKSRWSQRWLIAAFTGLVGLALGYLLSPPTYHDNWFFMGISIGSMLEIRETAS